MRLLLYSGSCQPAPQLAQAVIDASMQRGLLLLKAGVYGNAIRVLCPLVLTDGVRLRVARGRWDAMERALEMEEF